MAPTTPINADTSAGRRCISPVGTQTAGRSPSDLFRLQEASGDFLELPETSKRGSADCFAVRMDLSTDHSDHCAAKEQLEPCNGHRCARPFFTEKLLRDSVDRFWSMPSSFGKPSANGDSLLRRLWDSPPAVATLPVLGLHARTKRHSSLFLSLEEIGRQAGLSPDSVGRARRPLIKEGLVRSCGRALHHGKPVTAWDLDSARFVELEGGKSTSNCFLFRASILAGGQWARLSSVQKAVYLAVATLAVTSADPPTENALLRATAPSVALQPDVIACYRQQRYLRLASTSLAEISRICGVSRSSLVSAINELKSPAVWQGRQSNLAASRYSPLAVYPSDVAGRQHVYHFRDHVEHWPWEVLNKGRTCACVESPSPSTR